jgi:hypothetical protein
MRFGQPAPQGRPREASVAKQSEADSSLAWQPAAGYSAAFDPRRSQPFVAFQRRGPLPGADTNSGAMCIRRKSKFNRLPGARN